MTVSRFRTEKNRPSAREQRPEPVRPRMSRLNRARQFAPFAALGSMDEAMQQTQEAHPVPDPEYFDDPDLSGL